MDEQAAEAEHLSDLEASASMVAGALAAYFLWQRRKIAANMREYSVPEMVWEGVREVEQTTALRNRLTPVFEEIAEATVVKESTRIPSAKPKRPVKPLEPSVKYRRRLRQMGYTLPDQLVNATHGVASQMMEGPYWGDAAMLQYKHAEELLAEYLKETQSKRRAITEALKKLDAESKIRVDLIAETEANTAINGGRQVAADVRHVNAVDDSKTWMTVRDERVRATHRALHMISVPRAGMFNVGGYLAPHPGWWQLPLAQRIRCRCFLWVGAGADQFDYPLEPEFRTTV